MNSPHTIPRLEVLWSGSTWVVNCNFPTDHIKANYPLSLPIPAEAIIPQVRNRSGALPAQPLSRDNPPPPHPDALVQSVLQFVRANHVSGAHYFGLADKGLICALKAEPGFSLAITDYFDFWGSGSRFFSDESEGMPPPPESPSWLDGVICYQEGLADVPLLICDYPTEEAEHMAEAIAAGQDRRSFDFVAVIGRAARGFFPPLGLDWNRSYGFWLGKRIKSGDRA